jgi:hypothetical protein
VFQVDSNTVLRMCELTLGRLFSCRAGYSSNASSRVRPSDICVSRTDCMSSSKSDVENLPRCLIEVLAYLAIRKLSFKLGRILTDFLLPSIIYICHDHLHK